MKTYADKLRDMPVDILSQVIARQEFEIQSMQRDLDLMNQMMIEKMKFADYVRGQYNGVGKNMTTEEKAEMWDALMSSQRIRVMGSAGLKNETSLYKHIAVEFFSHHPAKTDEYAMAMFLEYVNALRVQNKEPK